MQRLLIFLFLVLSFETTTAQFPCPANLPLTLTGNTEYCVGTPGSELTVEESYDQYEWLPTTETSQSVLLTAGNYQLVLTHFTGCTDTIDIEIEQVSNPTQPVITADGPTEFCAGESVTLSGPPGYAYYEWSTGSVSQDITLYENITVVLSVEDFIGCTSSSNSIDVVVNPLPEAIVSPDINGYNVEFNNLSVNATDYSWNFGDGNTSTDFEPAHSFSLDGEVDVYLVASNDCGSDTAFLNLSSVSIDEPKPFEELVVYPNPSDGLVNLDFGQLMNGHVEVHMYSLGGKLVMNRIMQTQTGVTKSLLSFSNLPDGMYLLQIQSGEALTTRKLVLNSD